MLGHETRGHDIDPLQRAGHALHRREVAMLKPRQEHIEEAKADGKSKNDGRIDQMEAPPILLDGAPGFQPLQKHHLAFPRPYLGIVRMTPSRRTVSPFSLGLAEDQGDGRGVEPGVDRAEHGAKPGHGVMRLKERRHVRRDDGDGIALPDAGIG
jgi:hypothetical protein